MKQFNKRCKFISKLNKIIKEAQPERKIPTALL